MNKWTKLNPLPGRIIGCATCGFKPAYAEMERRIAVGFGDAHLEKDGEIIWSEDSKEWENCITVKEAEEIAVKDPDHDWRIVLEAPLSEAVYQRHEAGKWALVKTGQGFA